MFTILGRERTGEYVESVGRLLGRQFDAAGVTIVGRMEAQNTVEVRSEPCGRSRSGSNR